MEWEEKVEEQRKNDKHKKREHRDRGTPVFYVCYCESTDENQKSVKLAALLSKNAVIPSFLSLVEQVTPKRFASISTAFLMSMS